MPIMIVNPSKSPRKIKTGPQSCGPITARKATKGASMKKHRTAAQKRATARLVALNKSKHRNPSKRHHKVYHAKRRNPSGRGAAIHARAVGLFSKLISKEGLIGMGTLIAAPTVLDMGMRYIMPNATGYTRIAVKAGLGLGLGYALDRWVNKEAGFLLALTSIGIAVVEGIQEFQLQSGSASIVAPAAAATVSGYERRPSLAGYMPMRTRSFDVRNSIPALN